MPGRVSVRSSRPAATSKSKSRTTTAHDDVPDEGPSTTLRDNVCAIFTDVQRSNTGHRKLIIALRKIQEWCCYEPASGRSLSASEDYDENDFNTEFSRCILRILPVRKSEPAGDRIVKFLGQYLRHATEQDNAIFQEDDPDGLHGLPETPSSRLTSQIISLVLPLLQAKDKVVRFRCTQIISHLINTLDSVDDELFDHIRLGLLKRLRDKESSVRVQAVCGLGRLAGEGDAAQDPEDSDDDTAGGVLERLLDILQNDPSGEVRRSLLLNLPFTPTTLPYLLERARDMDGSLRRALYARLLPALGDFRHLSLTHREKLLRWGLRDRDDHVRKATGRLVRERWIEDCVRPRDADGNPEELKASQLYPPSSQGLMELLERIDVVNAGNDGGIAIDVMKDFWEGRPDYADFISFDEAYWRELTPESVFVARTFNDYCRQEGAPDALQEKLPEVTRLAFLLQSNINTLVTLVQRIAVQDEAEEDSVYQEFIVEQLLHIALTLDYSDEVGRRTMFSLMREALALAELPEEPTKLVVEVLRMSCGNNASSERDFCGVVLEAIAEVHDTIMGEPEAPKDEMDDSFHSARSELSGDSTPKRPQDEEVDEDKAIREIMVNMKCLHIAQCMLQNVECCLEDNAHLVTMLNSLVVPAVRSQEAPIRERGLLCLGLCCLLDKNLAEENLTLFLHCFTKGHEQLQMIAIQIIGDILAAHPSLLNKPLSSVEQGDAVQEQEHALHKPIHKLFSKSLKSQSAAVQSTACAALCKLMLSAPSTAHSTSGVSSSILNMEELLRLLVVAYFDPETASNTGLRQSLSYFIPVYCHSRKENMESMGSVSLTVLSWYMSLKDEMDVDGEDEAESEMVSVNVVLAHLADWTDGRKLAMARMGAFDASDDIEADTDVHVELAERVLEKMLGVSSREERKFYISLLGKLFINAECSPERLQNVATLVDEAIEDKIATDATTRNTLLKLQTAIGKCIAGTPGLSRSSAVSRAPSPGLSVAEDHDAEGQPDIAADETMDVTEGLSELQLQSATTTPAASPRKKARATPKSSRRRNAPDPTPTPMSEVGEEDITQTLISPDITPVASQSKRSRARRTTIASTVDGDTDEFEQENIPPPQPAEVDISTATSPTKKPRGRPKRATVSASESLPPPEEAAVDEPPEPVIKLEDAEDELGAPDEIKLPIKKPRGRPPKAPAAGAQPRKSVRAGRRKGAAASVDGDADFDG